MNELKAFTLLFAICSSDPVHADYRIDMKSHHNKINDLSRSYRERFGMR